MQTLTLLGIGKTLTMIVAALYRTIASLYSGMIEAATTFNSSELSTFLQSLIDNIYVLIGVFMLFRIAVSLLNYLVDPSKIDDKKIGGGQLVMHILISIVLLVSLRTIIIPVTNSVQNLLVCGDVKCEGTDGGILYKLIPDEYKNYSSNETADNIARSIVYKAVNNVPNVYAESTTLSDGTVKLACYYSLKSQERGNGNKNVGYEKVNIEVDFYKTKSSSYNNAIKLKYYTGGFLGTGVGRSKEDAIDNNGNYYFISSNDSEFLSIYNRIGDITFNNKSGMNSVSSGTCPTMLSTFGVLIYGNNNSVLGLTNGSSTKEGNKNDTVNSIVKNDGWYYPDEIASDVETAPGGYGGSLDPIGAAFSINLLKPFVEPSGELTTDFLTNRGSEDVVGSTTYWANKIEDEAMSSVDNKTTFSMDWLLAIIAGIAVAVVLIALCIEVVIRNLKLLFLQATAPIAIISYMNPNDKILSNWTKQYVGTFLSLFLYIIAIQIVPPMMNAMLNSINGNLIMTLVIIGGCLLFMKEAPKFLSKLFGLDGMAGSFGDSFKMVKTGLGIGAGAAAGAVMGGVTGIGVGWRPGSFLSGIAGGAFKGAKSGASGKILDGGKAQRQKNIQIRGANASGGTGKGRFAASWSRFWGQKDKYEKAEAMHKGASDTLGLIDKYKEEAEKGMVKLADRTDLFGENNVFAELASAKNELNRAQVSGGDVNAAMSKYKATQKQALSVYNDLLRGKNISVPPKEGLSERDRKNDIEKKLNGLAEIRATSKENIERLGAVEASIKNLGLSGSNGKPYQEYSTDAEDSIKLVKEQSQKEMEANRADHVIANNK